MCTAMLQDKRGLRVDESSVVDGGKGIRKGRFGGPRGQKVPDPSPARTFPSLSAPTRTMKEAYKCTRQGAQATSGIGVVARAKRLRRSSIARAARLKSLDDERH